MVKIVIVKMAAMKNAAKWKIDIFVTQIPIITDKQNLPKNMFLSVKNIIRLVKSWLLIIKGLKMEDGWRIPHQQIISSTDVPFLFML